MNPQKEPIELSPDCHQKPAAKRRKRTPKKTVEAGVVIRYRKDRPAKPWMLDHYARGVRYRASYATEEEAKLAAAELAGKQEEVGTAALALSPAELADAVEAVALLDGRATLSQVVKDWLGLHGEGGKTSVKEAVAMLIDAKRAAGRRPATLQDLAFRTRPFVAAFGSSAISSISTNMVEKWLGELKVGVVSRENYRRVLGGVFAFAVKRGLCYHNPVTAIERASIDESLPRFLSVEEVTAILRAAEGKKILPYFAVGFFAGLRPLNELRGLRWDDVDFDEGIIRVRPATAKRRRSRLVAISDNLRAWLAPYSGQGRGVYWRQAQFEAVVKAAGVEWSPDVMRHTFATYHLAAFGDAAKTALQLGHSGGVTMLFNHYRGLARQADAQQFWAIRPGKE